MEYFHPERSVQESYGNVNPESFYTTSDSLKYPTSKSDSSFDINTIIDNRLQESIFNNGQEKIPSHSSPNLTTQESCDGIYSPCSEGFLTPPPTPLHPVPPMQALLFQGQLPNVAENDRFVCYRENNPDEGLQEVPDTYNYDDKFLNDSPTSMVDTLRNMGNTDYKMQHHKGDEINSIYDCYYGYNAYINNMNNIENGKYYNTTNKIFTDENYQVENRPHYQRQYNYTPKYIDGYKPDYFCRHESKFGKISDRCSAGNRVSMKSRIIYSHPSVKSDFNLSQATHNVLERQRRNDLKLRFSILRTHIPELTKHDKAPKIQILTKALKYIKQLHYMEQKLLADKELEKQRKVVLMRCVNSFKAS